MSLSSLHSLLDRYFNEEELRTLCFHLGVDYDNLGGRGKAANARELVTRLHRQQRLAALLDLARQERPNVAWPDPPPPDDPAAAAALQAQAQTLFERGRALLAPHV
ncbi:MAG: hypothetical protein KC425_17830, partial [Anaerolineales bacterium]|nr:hypothetical protein [Anaerolineales bacterium]